eukprot:scaffold70504_cov60-Phaeocystis_antarctica.AAC.1
MLCRLIVVLALSGADALNLGAASSRRSVIAKAWLSARTTERAVVGCASGFPPCCHVHHNASLAPLPHATGRRRLRLARRRGARLRRVEGFADPCGQGRHDWHACD